MIVIRNCVIVDPIKGPKSFKEDIIIDKDKIVDIINSDPSINYECEIDAEGRMLFPGLIDIHSHFREPGQTYKESIETGSNAAAKGGFTTVVIMPNTLPPLDSVLNIAKIENNINTSKIRVYLAPSITNKRGGSKLVDIDAILSNFESIVFGFSDDGDFVQNGKIIKEGLVKLDGKFPIMEHCEDLSIEYKNGTINYGQLSKKYNQIGRPVKAELDAVVRDLKLAKESNGWIHIQHVSTKEAINQISNAKSNGINVTTEVTPHHIFLNENEFIHNLDPAFKVNPPLRTEEDAQYCLEALTNGLIDVIATDHAPHSREDKIGKFIECQSGISWLENAFGLVSERLGYKIACEKMSYSPGKFFKKLGLNIGLIQKGYQADFFIIEDRNWNLEAQKIESKSSNYIFKHGNGDLVNLKGKPILTFSSGKEVYNSGEVNSGNNV
jgi:dihydroorotase